MVYIASAPYYIIKEYSTPILLGLSGKVPTQKNIMQNTMVLRGGGGGGRQGKNEKLRFGGKEKRGKKEEIVLKKRDKRP